MLWCEYHTESMQQSYERHATLDQSGGKRKTREVNSGNPRECGTQASATTDWYLSQNLQETCWAQSSLEHGPSATLETARASPSIHKIACIWGQKILV